MPHKLHHPASDGSHHREPDPAQPGASDLSAQTTARGVHDRTGRKARRAIPADSALPSLLALKKGADALGVSERTARRLIDRGELPHVRVGAQIRISVDDLRAYIARNRR